MAPILVDAPAMLAAYDRLRRLADSDDDVIPGHDPLVAELFPAVPDAPAYRLHEPPRMPIRDAVAAQVSDA